MECPLKRPRDRKRMETGNNILKIKKTKVPGGNIDCESAKKWLGKKAIETEATSRKCWSL